MEPVWCSAPRSALPWMPRTSDVLSGGSLLPPVLEAEAWTPRELRHSFVSLLSSTGMSIEDISHLVGHASTRVTETVYRKELRPVLTRGASAMDALFPHQQPGS